LVFDKDLEALMANPGQISIPGGQNKEILLKITVPEKADTGDKSGEIRIKYLDNKKAKISVEFKIVKFESSKLKVSPEKIVLGEITAGNAEKKDLEFTNTNAFPIGGIMPVITRISASKNDVKDINSWIEFVPERIDSLKNGRENKQTMGVKVDVPANAKSEFITIYATMQPDYWGKQIQIDFEVKEAKVGIEIQGLSTNYRVQFDGNKYVPEVDPLSIYNSGEIDLGAISMGIETSCDGSWAAFLERDVNALAAGESATVRLNIEPLVSTPVGASQDCILRASTDNPLDPLGKPIEVLKNIHIETYQ
jgi:uncharacterized membrane protein